MKHASFQGPPSSLGRRGRGWIWFFAVLACLVVLALGLQWWYSQKQRLTPQQLADARALWRVHRPTAYDLEYTKKGNATGTFVVQVRQGKVVSATLDGQQLEARLYSSSDMEGLFDDLERFLEIDSSPGNPRTFTTATFDPQDGHLIRYIRSVMSQRWRVQIDVRLRPLSAGPEAAS